jgi:hypothetical protein
MQAISERNDRDAAVIRRDVLAAGQPVVLRGLVAAWPAVALARESDAALAAYLRRLDSGALIDALMAPPEAGGRMFYKPSMEGFDFLRNRVTLSSVLEQVQRYAAFNNPPAVAAQSALIRDCLPGFAAENRLTVLPESVLPRVWLGNAITTPAHVDESCNIACVVCGRRRFTLFPPEQIGNLYIGPLDYAPTGAPLSLVDIRKPDLAKFPKYAAAEAAGLCAELEPGDAIYIPPLWWHHVESLAPMNLLVNYWWPAGARGLASGDSTFDALLHGIVSIRDLPPATRAAWQAFFNYYVFGPQDPVVRHIPEFRRGVLGALSPQAVATLRSQLATRLNANK